VVVRSEVTEVCCIGIWIALVALMNDVTAMCYIGVMVSFSGPNI